MFIAGSDSKHFTNVAHNIYRFNPIFLKNEDTKRFHGLDERISVANFNESVMFMRSFIVKADCR
jgi:carboxypeptidase PM20D1